MSDLAFSGGHHVTNPVTDLEVSVAWYTTCLAAERISRFDHHREDGRVVDLGVAWSRATGPAADHPTMAGAVAGYTPVTLGVTARDELGRWVAHLDAHHIVHSAVATRRIGDSVDVESPDGRVLRFYTDPAGGIDAVEFTE